MRLKSERLLPQLGALKQSPEQRALTGNTHRVGAAQRSEHESGQYPAAVSALDF